MYTVLWAILACTNVLAAPGPASAMGIEMLTTAANGTSVAAPSKNTFFLCPGKKIPVNGTFFEFPSTLTKPNSSWVTGNSIVIPKIPTVNGSVTMDHEFEMTVTDTGRRLKGNGIPNHPIGVFPIPNGTVAYDIYSQLPAQGYPNAAEIPVAPYDLDVTLPRNPVMNDKPSCIDSLMMGIASQTGAAWHIEYAIDNNHNAVDPNAALPTDLCWGHPYQTQYHYHGYSWKCFPDQGQAGEHSPLFGYALDGFGIYGPRSENGVLVTNAELDECHGHSHQIDWDGNVTEMYHYHVNTEYPYSVGCFRGTPVQMDHGNNGQVSLGNGANVSDHAAMSPGNGGVSAMAPAAQSMAATSTFSVVACVLVTWVLLLA